MKQLVVYTPGTVPYGTALAFQMACVEELKSSIPAPEETRESGYLILLSHPPVITLGRRGTRDNILVPERRLRAEGIQVVEASRGGDVTYHGPGQIVGYPIIRLDPDRRDIHGYLRDLEWVIMRCLADYGIASERRSGYTGVWVGREKIAAMGVAISRWVTYHGFALNLAPNFAHFALIRPCGIREGGVTSMEKVLGHRVPRAEVESALVEHFRAVFGFDEVVKRNALALPAAAQAIHG
jgi:lipoate-protein ligase B